MNLTQELRKTLLAHSLSKYSKKNPSHGEMEGFRDGFNKACELLANEID